MVAELPRHRPTIELQKGLSGVGAPHAGSGSQPAFVLWVLLGVAIMVAGLLALAVRSVPDQN